jgi:hypothetical protein
MTSLEKKPCEDLLGMASGYVLDFSNRTFQDFVQEHAGTDIYATKYAGNGNSKASRLRAFWQSEPDTSVGKILTELLDYWRYLNPIPDSTQQARAERFKQVAERLSGKRVDPVQSETAFLGVDFSSVSLSSAKVEPSVLPILESRLAEATRCLQAGAPLAVIFMCGSILEGLLLGLACTEPQKFNAAPNSPKDRTTQKVRSFHDWRLAELIDVACEVGYLKLDVKKFSHALRDFRNYIHPHQQMSSGFSPDKHTAEICMQVLKEAIASLSGQRP